MNRVNIHILQTSTTMLQLAGITVNLVLPVAVEGVVVGVVVGLVVGVVEICTLQSGGPLKQPEHVLSVTGQDVRRMQVKAGKLVPSYQV